MIKVTNRWRYNESSGVWTGSASDGGSGRGNGSTAIRCEPGYYCPAGSSLQFEAEGGYYSAVSGLAQPVVCPPGAYCPPRSKRTTACPAGTACSWPAGLNVSDCQPCAPGSYSPPPPPPPSGDVSVSVGWTACTLCQAGSFQADSGHSDCDLCPSGSFQPTRGAQGPSAQACTPCPPGGVAVTAKGLASVAECFQTPTQVQVVVRLQVQGVPLGAQERSAFLSSLQASLVALLALSDLWTLTLRIATDADLRSDSTARSESLSESWSSDRSKWKLKPQSAAGSWQIGSAAFAPSGAGPAVGEAREGGGALRSWVGHGRQSWVLHVQPVGRRSS